MKITPQSIQEMRANGYCPTTIRDQIKRKEGNLYFSVRAHQLLLLIENVFSEVKIGDGIGLKESRGLDDYENVDVLNKLRNDDFKGSWQDLPYEQLFAYRSSISFLDAEGMRFHLPAYICAELRGEADGEIIFSLSHVDHDHSKSKFELLSIKQREAIRAFLLFILEHPDSSYDFERGSIQIALESYWKACFTTP